MPRYSLERRQSVLGKLLPPQSRPVPEVAAAEGISEATLYNWLTQPDEMECPCPVAVVKPLMTGVTKPNSPQSFKPN